MNVGEQLHDLAEKLLALIRATREVAQKKALRTKLTAVLKETERLAAINVRTDTKKYRAACEALDEANREVRGALDDLATVAKTMHTVAEVLDLVAEIGAKAGGA